MTAPLQHPKTRRRKMISSGTITPKEISKMSTSQRTRKKLQVQNWRLKIFALGPKPQLLIHSTVYRYLSSCLLPTALNPRVGLAQLIQVLLCEERNLKRSVLFSFQNGTISAFATESPLWRDASEKQSTSFPGWTPRSISRNYSPNFCRSRRRIVP